MIIGVPVFAVFYAGVRTAINRMLKRKHLPIETQKYMNVGSIRNQEFIDYKPSQKKRQRKGKNPASNKTGATADKADNTGELEDLEKEEKFILDDDDDNC